MFHVIKQMHFLHVVWKELQALEAMSPFLRTTHELQDVSLF